MDTVKIRIGGVPEHYNLPIHLAKEAGAFSKRGIDLEWTDFGSKKHVTDVKVNNAVRVCEKVIK